MFILNWWNSLGLASQFFFCVAIPATLVLLVQTVLMFLGIGNDADGIGDDIPDDVTADGDISDGVFGDDGTSDVTDLEGLDGLRVFTVRGVVAFLVVFGWVGVVMDGAGAPLYATVPVAAVSGLAVMLLLAVLFRFAMRLRNDGNTDNKNAIGVSGKVYLTVPPSRTGEGKVQIMLQGSYVERNAVTDDTEPIPTGCEIVVVGVSGQTDLVIKRK
ncbi:MAG: hypothetical protein E7641_02225 [Ruminococcaceae bacterium]|nr:hypothetical protein [Oscillospiraceae bacterium]